MPLATPYEYTQDTAKLVIESGGQILTVVTYIVADNTIIILPRGAVDVPIRTAIGANISLIDFCNMVVVTYNPSMAHTIKVESSLESEPASSEFTAKIKVGLDELTDLTVDEDSIVHAAARNVGPIKFPEFFFALLKVTRMLKSIDATLSGKTTFIRDFA